MTRAAPRLPRPTPSFHGQSWPSPAAPQPSPAHHPMTKSEHEVYCARQHAPAPPPQLTTSAATADPDASGTRRPASCTGWPSLASHTADPRRRGLRACGCRGRQPVSGFPHHQQHTSDQRRREGPRSSRRCRPGRGASAWQRPTGALHWVAPTAAAGPAGGSHQALKSLGYSNPSQNPNPLPGTKVPRALAADGPARRRGRRAHRLRHGGRGRGAHRGDVGEAVVGEQRHRRRKRRHRQVQLEGVERGAGLGVGVGAAAAGRRGRGPGAERGGRRLRCARRAGARRRAAKACAGQH